MATEQPVKFRDNRTPVKTFKALAIAAAVFVACDQGPPARPNPLDDVAAWEKFCTSKPNCGLCASEGNCGYCPDTNRCMRFSSSDQTAKLLCPSLITVMEHCL